MAFEDCKIDVFKGSLMSSGRIQSVLIGDLMLVDPPYLYTNNKISHARTVFNHTRLKTIPIVQKGMGVVGLLERKAVVHEHIPADTQVERYMVSPVPTINELEPVTELARVTEDIDMIPVVSSNHRLRGIVPNPRFITSVVASINEWSEQLFLDESKEIGALGIIIINQDGEIVCFNEKAEKIMGIKAKDIYGLHVKKVIHGSSLHDVVKKGRVERKRKVNAEQVVLCSHKFPLYVDGEIVGALGTFADLAKQENLTDWLKAMQGVNMEMVDILESINDGILVLDAAGHVIMSNKASESILRMSANQVLGLTYENLAETTDFPVDTVRSVFLTKKTCHIRQQIYDREYLVIASPALDGDGEVNRVVIDLKDVALLNELVLDIHLSQEANKSVSPEPAVTGPANVVVKSLAMRRVVSLAHKVAVVDSTVLITGETGVGKEIIARLIHERSRRMDGPFIKLNCGAIPEPLVESELFGYEAGAFTGAHKEGKPGIIELADGGTLFLDEVAELSVPLQVKLLRVLQERELTRIGATTSKKVDFRLVAATNKDIQQLVREKSFREDLFYRLNVVPIHIPPLRERQDDIIPLVMFFLNKFNQMYSLENEISQEAIRCLIRHSWPGNVRELENTLERLIVTSDVNTIGIEELNLHSKIEVAVTEEEVYQPRGLAQYLEETERRLLAKSMERCKTTREMAEELGISQSAVVKKLKKYGLTKG